jgi:hypothetical protein
MTDSVSDLLMASIVAIIITILLMVIFVLSGVGDNMGKWALPVYQIAFTVWILITITIFGLIQRSERKSYGDH